MMLVRLREEVCRANVKLAECDLVTLTWGNVSGIDRETGLVVIKPRGVSFRELHPDVLVIVDMQGKKVEGRLNPSCDTMTHLELYRNFRNIRGVAHSHSLYATMFAQACRTIPCMGTTHAECFLGNVPVTRALSEQEVEEDYETNTGKVIVECFRDMDYLKMPAVLVAHRGPFTWGGTVAEALDNSIALERVAQMAYGAMRLNGELEAIPQHISEKHYSRRHGREGKRGNPR